MFAFKASLIKLLIVVTVSLNTAIAEINEVISLQQSIKLALEYDAQIAVLFEKQKSWQELSLATQTWDDPKLLIGAQAVPLDSFDLKQEPMTQLVLGYQQMFPRGNSLQQKSDVLQANSAVEAAKLALRQRDITRNVKKTWYEIWHLHNSIKIIQYNRNVFKKMLDINQSFYSSGRINQQSVVQAELDISLIDDRLQTMQSKLLVAHETFAKFIGGNYELGIVGNSLEVGIEKQYEIENLQKKLQSHPELMRAEALLEMSKSDLALEKEKYSSQWGLDVRYGKRQGENINGSDRDDFLTAMVSVDLPVFTEQKQDRQVAASRSKMQSVKYQLIDVERELLKKLKQEDARLTKLKQRLSLYKEKINPQAKQNSEVAMRGYQSGVVDFLTLSKAQVTEFNTQLAELNLQYQYMKTQSEIEFLVGDKQ